MLNIHMPGYVLGVDITERLSRGDSKGSAVTCD